MTQQQALEAKDLAKPCNEALGVITERECPKCKGSGSKIRVPGIKLGNRDWGTVQCSICNGTGKVGWKWKPEVGQSCFLRIDLHIGAGGVVSSDEELTIVKGEVSQPKYDVKLWIPSLADAYCFEQKDIIPILPWEEIERVLEGVGYEIDLVHTSYRNVKEEHNVEIYPKDEARNRIVWNCKGKSRQEAVMKAVIKLGKELNVKSK